MKKIGYYEMMREAEQHHREMWRWLAKNPFADLPWRKSENDK